MKAIVLKSLALSVIAGLAAYAYSSLPDVAQLRRKNPKGTALMELRDAEYRQKGMRLERRQVWVPYEAISEHLKDAIILSEDASFFSHKGVDVFELKEAAKEDWKKGKLKRGGSTITMQLARNLYLSPSKNPLRKLEEIVIAWELERSLSKRRIFELYLNVVEWGVDIYGAEAAARHYFSKPASDLDPAEAATLAALLPSPRRPGPKSLLRRRDLILSRMHAVGEISEDELQGFERAPIGGSLSTAPQQGGEEKIEDQPMEESAP